MINTGQWLNKQSCRKYEVFPLTLACASHLEKMVEQPIIMCD